MFLYENSGIQYQYNGQNYTLLSSIFYIEPTQGGGKPFLNITVQYRITVNNPIEFFLNYIIYFNKLCSSY